MNRIDTVIAKVRGWSGDSLIRGSFSATGRVHLAYPIKNGGWLAQCGTDGDDLSSSQSDITCKKCLNLEPLKA